MRAQVIRRQLPAASRWLVLAASGMVVWSPVVAQSIINTTSLSFGAFVAGSGGTVVVNANGSRSKAGGVLLVSQGASAAAAQFTVSGSADASYSITLADDDTVTLSDGNSHTMAVNGFVSSPSGSGTLSGGGTQLLSVGATLSVGNGQSPGSYSGSFSVTVEYE